MKKIIGIITGVLILIILGVFVYRVFIDCEKVTTSYERYFTLSEMDYAVIDDNLVVKLLDIKDDKDKGQTIVKLLVINESKIAYVELGSVDPKRVFTEKLTLEYTINLIRIDDDGATLEVHPTKDEEKL